MGRAHKQNGPYPAGSAQAADVATERLAAFAHELANLLDGAMRSVTLAREGLANPAHAQTAATATEQLRMTSDALTRMSELLKSAMSPNAPVWAVTPSRAAISLADAIEHAAGVVRPLAEERGVSLLVEGVQSVRHARAGGLYTPISNALRNAVEACNGNGCVVLRARLEPAGGRRAVCVIEIADDGPGPTDDALRFAFEPRFTSKQRGAGLGLAISRDVIDSIGGAIDLMRRPDMQHGGLLVIRAPVELEP